MKRTILSASILLSLGVPLAAFGCSSSDSQKSDNDTTPIDLGSSGSGSIIPGNGSLNGGMVPLTKAQVDSIKGASCVGQAVEGESLPSVLELVIDVSSSMKDPAPGTNRSKWEVTRDALINAVPGPASGGGLSSSIGVGLLFYPNTKSTANPAPVDITSCVNTSAIVPPAQLGAANAAQRTKVRDAIQQAVLQQSTPTHDAYKYAFENGIQKTKLPGKKFMLLITDGTPTLSLGCVNTTGSFNGVDPEPIVAQIQTAANAGIKTFLIGSPGSESNRNWMSRAARIGGTALPNCSDNGPNYCHMDMTTAPNFSDELAKGLSSIVGAITPCNYTFPPPPSGQTIDANLINVILTSSSGSQLAVRDDQGDCTQGWKLTSGNEIQLCADTCKAVQQDQSISIDVVFGCSSLAQPPK
ncbi:MAG TPA: vWA domain-containing protein [Polyangiaceae bacterium]|nr:vWA domain-containing protein [Polyangiaceae bacterium]